MTIAPRRLVHAVLTAVAIMLVAPAASPGASPGDPHPVFATFQQHVGPATGQESATDVIVQPDGKVLVSILNDAEVDPRIIRLLPSGALDPTFAVGGVWTKPSVNNIYIRAISVQPDGKILWSGNDASAPGIIIGRLTPTGEPDITFSSDGEFFMSTPANSAPLVEDMFVEASGNITFVGIIRNGARNDDLFMGRLTNVGTDDPSFAGAAPLFLFGSPYDGVPDGFGGITQMPNGDYIVGNPQVGTATQIWRINSTAGSRVAANVSFNTAFNKPIDVMPISATHAVVLLEGSSRSGLAYLDVRATPVIDRSGSVGNAGEIEPFPSTFKGHELLRQGDGRFFVAGIDSTDALHRAIMRLNPAGTPDTTWAPGGIKHLSGTSSARFYLDRHALAFTPDGGLVSAYHSYAGTTERRTTVEAWVSRVARMRPTITTPPVKGVVGTVVDYTVRAVNDGPNASGSGVLTFSVGAGLRITSWVGTDCTIDTGGGTCRFGSLQAGENKTVVLKVKAVSAGTHDMSASVDAGVYDDDTSNDSTVASHLFEPVPTAVAAGGITTAENSKPKPKPTKAKVLKLTLVRINRFDGRVLRGCGTARVMCKVARVRGGRAPDAYLRAEASVAGRRTVLLILQTKVGKRWVTKYNYRLPIGENGGLDIKLPTDWRAKPGTWRIRTQTIPKRGKKATVSAWMMYRVR